MVGAVIAAAGIASRMGEFKPLLKFGNMTIIERIISTLKGAGIEEIVVVTGSNAKQLEDFLKHQGIVFLRNEEYLTTHMLDSAKIGFRYLKGRCDKIIFTPADIPLYTQETVKKLLQTGAEAAYPVFQNKKGHPLCLSEKIIDNILTYKGEGGLKGALKQLKQVEEVPVEDQGVMFDIDMKMDYEKLLKIHNKQIYRVEYEVKITKEAVAIDDEIARLLYLIDIMGSVMEASAKMNISYSKALKLITQMERELGRQIVVKKQGGAQGGYAYLTDDGKELLRRFRQFQAKLKETLMPLFNASFAGFLDK